MIIYGKTAISGLLDRRVKLFCIFRRETLVNCDTSKSLWHSFFAQYISWTQTVIGRSTCYFIPDTSKIPQLLGKFLGIL